jgi:hypothetical protein
MPQARLVTAGSESALTVLPGGTQGGELVDFRAPASGTFEVRVESANRLAGVARSMVTNTASAPTPDDSVALAALAAASGGAVVPLDGGRRSVRAGLSAASETVTWRPMHAWWWLPVFVGLLGFEWLMRRRAGLT